MRNIVRDYADKFLHERQAKIRLIRIIVILGLVVSMAVFWELRYTGIALTNETNCGLEEHTHTEECYEDVLVCGQEESGAHVHSNACYETQYVLVCGQEESEGTPAVEGHKHTDACYETVTETRLICGQEERAGTPAVEGHTHTDSCYSEDGNLICGQEERAGTPAVEGHTHTDACYETVSETNLVCGQEESESIPAVEGHTHTDACYETQTVLVCGLEEGDPAGGHVHTDACYERQLVCDKEEHTHTLACMSDDTADVETASAWESTLPDHLTGIWADDLILVARSQLGYTESTENYTVTESGDKKGYTRYGAWYGDPYGDWCAMFVSFCLNYAGIGTDLMPRNSGCYAWTVDLSNWEMYASASGYTPKVGDIVFFDWTGDGRSNHVGIVEEVTYRTADGRTLSDEEAGEVYVDENGRMVIDVDTEVEVEVELEVDPDTAEEAEIVEETDAADEDIEIEYFEEDVAEDAGEETAGEADAEESGEEIVEETDAEDSGEEIVEDAGAEDSGEEIIEETDAEDAGVEIVEDAGAEESGEEIAVIDDKVNYDYYADADEGIDAAVNVEDIEPETETVIETRTETVEVYAASIKTIEGNASNMVKEKSYDAGNGNILGYGILPQQPEDEIEEAILESESEDEEESDEEEIDEEVVETDDAEEIMEDELGEESENDAEETDAEIAKVKAGTYFDAATEYDGEPTGGILYVENYGGEKDEDNIMPLDGTSGDEWGHEQGGDGGYIGSGDHDGDIYVESMHISDATYDIEKGMYKTHFDITFTIDSNDLEYDVDDSKYDELELFLPEGVDPSEFTDTYVGYVRNSETGVTEAGFTFHFEYDEEKGVWKAILIFENGYYEVGEEECWLEFDVWVSADNVGDDGQLHVGYEDGSETTGTIIPGNATSGGDITATKSASEYDEETGSITYTITISSVVGTSSYVTVEDLLSITGGFELNDADSDIVLGSITYSDENGNRVLSGYELKAFKNADGSYSISIVDGEGNGLPAMGENSTYTIIYTVNLELSDDYIGDSYATNGVDVTSTDKWDHKLEDESNKPTVSVNRNRTLIQKNGVLNSGEDGDYITWTITVNTGNYPADIADWILTDASFTDKDSITIKKSDESNAVEGVDYELVDNGDGTFTVKFLPTDNDESGQKTVNKNSYTITYIEEQLDDPALGQTDTSVNEAGFGEDGENTGTGTASETGGSVEKEHNHTVGNADGTLNVEWTTTIHIPEAGILSGTVIEDYLGRWGDGRSSYNGSDFTEQWYTADQIKDMFSGLYTGSMTFNNEDGTGTVTVIDADTGKEITLTYGSGNGYTISVYDWTLGDWVDLEDIMDSNDYDNDHFTAWQLTFNRNVVLSEDGVYVMNYTSTRQAEEINGFFNYVYIGDLYASANDNGAGGAVTKTDGKGNTGTSQVEIGDGGILTWVVYVTVNENYDGEYIVIDSLPEGTTLQSVYIKNVGFISDTYVLEYAGEGVYDVTGTYYYTYTYPDEWAEEYIKEHPEAYNYVPYHAEVIVLDSNGNEVTDVSSAYDENGDLKEGYTQQVKIWLPQEQVSRMADPSWNQGSRQFELTYTVKLSDDEIEKLKEWYLDGNLTAESYENSVEVTYNGSKYGDATQKEEVTYGRESDLDVTKTLVTNGDQSPVQLMYSVLLNPEGLDLLTGQGGEYDWLEFWDQLQIGYNTIGLFANIDPSSVSFCTVTKLTPTAAALENPDLYGEYWYADEYGEKHYVTYDENSTDIYVSEGVNVYLIGDELSISWTYDQDTYTLYATVPDQTAILVRYNYDLSWTDGHSGTEVISLTNVAHLKGDADEYNENHEDGSFIDTNISGGIINKNEVDIYKVQSGDYAIYLPGATFTLWIYQDDEWVQATDENGIPIQFITDETGEVTVSETILENLGVFSRNTGYYLVESEAPQGYELDNGAKLYFYWSSTDTTVYPISYPDGFTTSTEYGSSGAVDLDSYNYPYFWENDLVPEEDVSVEKKWVYEYDDGTQKELSEDEKRELWADVQLYYYLSDQVPEGWGDEDLPGHHLGSATVTILTEWSGSRTDASQTVSAGDTVTITLTDISEWTNTLIDGWILTINGKEVDITPSIIHSGQGIKSITYVIPSEYVVAGAEIVLENDGQYNEQYITFEITAVNNDPEPEESDEVIHEYGPYTDAEGHTYIFRLDYDNDWTHVFEDLPEYWEDADGNIWWYYYYFVEIDVSEEWNTQNATYSDGTLVFTPNGDGTYSLSGGSGVDGLGNDINTVTITNVKSESEKYELPKAGGMGTRRFTLIGLLLVVAAGSGVLLFRDNRRKRGCER